MRVVIAGGTGFLGSALNASLRSDGHAVTVLTRRARSAGQLAWTPGLDGAWVQAVAAADAVVNLAGEPLETGRWSALRKERILQSRVLATRALAGAIGGAGRPPAVFVNASAIGLYGPHGDDVITEAAPAGDDFLASVCVAWEREATVAAARTRVVLLRTGLALDRSDGALPRLALPFRLFAGGPIGDGRQWWSWIHVADWVALTRWALANDGLTGPLNLTAPAPVTNREFARTLGRVLHRPALLPAPAVALRILLGEMADALILSGQRVVPQRALEGGFTFRFPTLDAALSDLYGRA